jgi:hypothetical protein
MVQYFAATLRRNGGLFADARLIVSVGEDCEPFDIAAAVPQLAPYDITWRWVDREAFRLHTYFATGLDRWAEPFESDFVLMADADMLVTGNFSDIADKLAQPRGIAGVIATFPPWLACKKGDVDRERWQEMFGLAGLPPPVFDCLHPGYGVYYPAGSGMQFAPAYYNFGFVFGTRDAMNAIGKTFTRDYLLAVDFMQTVLAAQAGLTLSIIRNNVSYLALPVRYNFWSHDPYFDAFPSDSEDIRVMHYNNGSFRKDQDIGSPDMVAAWLEAHKRDTGRHAELVFGAVKQAHAFVLSDIAE